MEIVNNPDLVEVPFEMLPSPEKRKKKRQKANKLYVAKKKRTAVA